MKQCKRKDLLIVLFLFLAIKLQAQQTTDASGGNATGSGGSASYSVGQVVYTTNTGSNGSSAQGVQQPYEISTVLSIPEANAIQLMTVYPNPSTSNVVLNVGNYNTTSLSFQLIDNDGRMIMGNIVRNAESTLPLDNLPVAVYFLKVIDNGTTVKTFKIIKQ